MKIPLALDDYTEVLPEDEMDQDLKKALKEMTDAISGLSRHTVETRTNSAGAFEVERSIQAKLEILDERSKWHRNIGWGIATLYGAALVAIVTFWIPREIAIARSGITDSVKIDTAAQLLPLQIQLAKITGLMELRQSKDVAQAIDQSADFATPRPAIEAIKAIAQQARAEKLITSPSVLREVNAQIQNAVSSDPKLNKDAWSARLALLDYRSALQQPFHGNPVLTPSPAAPSLPLMQEFVFRDARQKLDGFFWKDIVFENTRIEYDGGPMALQNVRFINCTFTMKYTPRADKFAELILDQNDISGSLS